MFFPVQEDTSAGQTLPMCLEGGREFYFALPSRAKTGRSWFHPEWKCGLRDWCKNSSQDPSLLTVVLWNTAALYIAVDDLRYWALTCKRASIEPKPRNQFWFPVRLADSGPEDVKGLEKHSEPGLTEVRWTKVFTNNNSFISHVITQLWLYCVEI